MSLFIIQVLCRTPLEEWGGERRLLQAGRIRTAKLTDERGIDEEAGFMALNPCARDKAMSRSEKSDELDLRWTTALVMVSEYLMYSPRVKMTREQALANYWVKSESDPRRMKEGDQVADGLATHRRMQAELRRDLALDHNEKFFP